MVRNEAMHELFSLFTSRPRSAIKSEACPVVTSNPVAIVDSHLNTVVAYAQCKDGQVGSLVVLTLLNDAMLGVLIHSTG